MHTRYANQNFGTRSLCIRCCAVLCYCSCLRDLFCLVPRLFDKAHNLLLRNTIEVDDYHNSNCQPMVMIKGRAISTPLPAISTYLIPPAGVHLLTSSYYSNYYRRTRRSYVIMQIIIKKYQVLKMKLFVTTPILIHLNRLNQTLYLKYIPQYY